MTHELPFSYVNVAVERNKGAGEEVFNLSVVHFISLNLPFLWAMWI